jgi:hypothetical protein
MTEPETPDIDRRLREAFDDDAVAAARVARAALAEDEVLASRVTRSALILDNAGDGRLDRRSAAAKAPHARRCWAAVAAAGAAVLLVASALVFWPARPLPEPAAEPSEPPMLSGVITDGALVVSMPDGSVLISAGGPRTDRLPDGFALVIVEGAIR